MYLTSTLSTFHYVRVDPDINYVTFFYCFCVCVCLLPGFCEYTIAFKLVIKEIRNDAHLFILQNISQVQNQTKLNINIFIYKLKCD